MTEREFLQAYEAHKRLLSQPAIGVEQLIDDFLTKFHKHYYEVEFILKETPDDAPYRPIKHNTTRQYSRKRRGLDNESTQDNS
jgi:hypothetical protein